MDDDLIYWLALDRCQILAANYFINLCKKSGSAEILWNATKNELLSLGLKNNTIDLFFFAKKNIIPQTIPEKLQKQKIFAVTYKDPRYPLLLKEISDPPAIIYIKGNTNLDIEGIGIVGSRKMTGYGKSVAHELAKKLSENGICVLSGLATGIDSEAHRGSLEGIGRPIAVLGGGLDKIYPSINTGLANKILDCGGSLISERPPQTETRKYFFVARNRIISGLSKGVIVVEAPQKSGSLITADFALDQGRNVYAIPGNINSLYSIGTNNLIKNGAKPVTKIIDVLEDLNINNKTTSKTNNYTEFEKKILACLNEPKNINQLSRELLLQTVELSPALMLMELNGIIKNLGDLTYIKINNREPEL